MPIHSCKLFRRWRYPNLSEEIWEGRVKKTQMPVFWGWGAPQAWMPALPAKPCPAARQYSAITPVWWQTGQARTRSCSGGLEQLCYFGENFTKSFKIPCRLCNPGTVICVLLEQIFLKYHSVCVCLSCPHSTSGQSVSLLTLPWKLWKQFTALLCGSLSGFYYVSFELLASPYFSGVVGAGQENGS